MREIKFRAWDKVRKKMIYPNPPEKITEEVGDYSFEISLDGSFSITERQTTSIGDRWVCRSWDSFLLMQFTGLTDKNDREVFEGDIYRIEEETDGLDEVFYVVVIWIDEWSMFASVLLEEYNRYKVGGVKELDEQLFWTYSLEDINSNKHFYCRNIHQDSHLLK